jgi:isopenicillin N synthase-like dioxygenase
LQILNVIIILNREVVATYTQETKHLFLAIMEAILESLGIMEDNQEEEAKENDNNNNINIMKELDNGSQMLVTNFYPPCPEPDLTLGMHPHSDYGFLTLLLQDEVEGLQIQFQDKWLTVQPIPNAFVINIGDHLEVINCVTYLKITYIYICQTTRVESSRKR